MEEIETKEIVEDDDDTREQDLYEGSLYPYPPKPEIEKIEVDVRETAFSVFELVRQFDRKMLIINPEFQRNRVWTPRQMSWFMESILLNIPLPHLYLNQKHSGPYIVVDGLQRTTTISDFLNDRFYLQELEALPWLNGKRFSDLEDKLQARVEDRKLPCYIVKPSVPVKMIYDIFKRINTGGTQLQRQEIRNCIYLGKSTRLLRELSAQEYFKKAIDWGIASKRMKDQEAVLRYIAFRIFDYEKDYKSDMDDFLGRVMVKINTKMGEDEIQELKDDFERVMQSTYKFFRGKNFRIPTYSSRGRINIAVIESVGRFFSIKDNRFLNSHKEKIIDNYSRLVKDLDYLDAVKISTGDRKRVKKRFELAEDILGNV